MLIGNRPVATFLSSTAATPASSTSQSGRGTPSKAASAAAAASPEASTPVDPNATLASLLVAALLRNVAVDGGRNEDSDTVGPSPTSSSGKASLAILTARTASLEAYARGDLSGDGSKKPSSTSAALNAVADLATSALTLPTTIVGKLLEDTPDPVAKPLSERSALLLLLLAHNLRSMEGPVVPNPYRDALARLSDSGVAAVTYTTPLPPPSALAKSVPVPFKPLFTALVALGEQPLGVCLLYTLLQSSRGWCEMVLSRGDVDQLLLPLLKQLYSVPTLGSEHRYILLITLLLFTQVRIFSTGITRQSLDISLFPSLSFYTHTHTHTLAHASANLYPLSSHFPFTPLLLPTPLGCCLLRDRPPACARPSPLPDVVP
jgi:hypothetical protein